MKKVLLSLFLVLTVLCLSVTALATEETAADTFAQPPTFLVDEGYEAVLNNKTYSQSVIAETPTTVYVDGTGTTEGSYATVEEAIAALPTAGGTVIVCGDTTLSTTTRVELPAKGGKVTITGQNGAKLTIGWGIRLSCETEFDDIELVNASSGLGYISAMGNKLTIGDGVTTSVSNSNDRYLTIYGSTDGSEASAYDTHVIVKAGTWRHIFGGGKGTFDGDATVEVSNVTVTHKLSAANEMGTFNGTPTLIVDLCGNKTVTAANYLETPTVLVDDGYTAVLDGTTYLQVASDSQDAFHVYVDGQGYATLEEAIEALPDAGGEVLVRGQLTVGTIDEMLTLPAKSGKITIVGENGAKLKIARGIALGCEVEFDDIELVNISATEGFIAADGHKLTVGAGVTTSRENTERWLTVLGGNKTAVETSYDTHVVVKAGTWRYIFGGNATATFNGNATVEVSNITVTTLSAVNEKGTFNGTAALTVDLRGDKTVTATTYVGNPTVLTDAGYVADFRNNTYSQRKVVAAYISASAGADTNDGLSADTPKATLDGVAEMLREGGRLILVGDMGTDGAYVWNLGGDTTVTAEDNGKWNLADGAALTVWSNLILDGMTFTHGGDTTVRVDRAVLAVTDTVDLAATSGTHTLVVEENAVAILSEAAKAFFTVEGEGTVVTYDPAEGVVIPTEYSNGSLEPIYNSQEYIEYFGEKSEPSLRYTEGTDLETWRNEAAAKLAELLGLPYEACEDDAFTILSKTEYTGYTRVDFEFQSEPGYFVKAAMLIPAGAGGKLPCVITLQGHTTGMHISLGETKFDGDAALIAAGYDYALQAVENGMIAVAIDQRYMGAAGQDSTTGKPACGDTNVNTLLYGRTPIGERVWDVQRLIDVLFTHFGDFVDENNLICLGNEMGGMTTLFASALDARIRIAVPASALCKYGDAIVAKSPCRCYDIPGFEKYFDMGDLGALIAPRKLLVVSGRTDLAFPVAGAEESFALIQSTYTMLDATDNCTHLVGNGGSGLYADEAWPIIHSYLETGAESTGATAADITAATETGTSVDKIYDSKAYIQHIAKTHAPLMRYQEGEDFDEWSAKAREKLAELLGLPLEKCEDDHFRILSETAYDTHTRISFEFQSEENYFVRAVMLIPAGATGKLPCLIALQGHSQGMQVSLGELKFDRDLGLILGGQDFAARAMREGVIGIAIEQRYMGSAGQAANGTSACLGGATRDAHYYGRSAIGERVWDVSRTIDILEKYFGEQIDFNNLMLAGNSGGGTATFYASCMDERIKISIPSCGVCTYRDSIVAMWHCRCNYVPGAAKYFDMGDLGGLIAPRKLLLVNGKSDGIFPLAGAKESFAVIQNAYNTAEASDNCYHLVGNGGHMFFPNDAWPILHEWLGTEREEVTTVYVDGTGATPGAYTRLAEAASRLPDSGGTIIVCGDTEVGYYSEAQTAAETMPEKSGKITITAENGAKLIVKNTVRIGCDTVIDNIELCNAATSGYIYACGHKLTIGENVTTTLADGYNNYLWLFAGYPDWDGESTHLIVKAGTYKNIYGANFNSTFTGTTKVELSNVTVTGTLSGKSVSNFKGASYEVIIDLRGNKTVTAGTYAHTPTTFLTDDGYVSVLKGTTYSQVESAQIVDTVYVDGTGATENAYTTLEEAISMLPDTGGTVIVTGDTVLGSSTSALPLPAKSGKVTIIGQADANGVLPSLTVMRTLILNSEVEFDSIDLCCGHNTYGYVYAQGHKLTIGENVTTSSARGVTRYLMIFGGYSNSDGVSTHLVIKAGTYTDIIGANFNSKFTGTSKVEVSNVTVLSTLSAKSKSNFSGTSELLLDLRGNKTVTAGTFVEPTFLTDDGYVAVLKGTTYSQVESAQIVDTVYVDGTGATENAYTTLEEAISMLPDTGGTVIVCGDTSLALTANQTLPTKGGKVIIRGSEKTVKITIAKDLVLGSETEFDNLTLYTKTSSAENLVANGNKLTIGENVITECASGARYIRVFGGSRTANTTYDTHLVLKAGTFRAVLGGNESGKTFTGRATVELSGVTVTTKLTEGNNGSGFNGTGEIILDLRGNKTVTVPAALTDPTILTDDGYAAVLDGTTYKQVASASIPNVVYADSTGVTEGVYTTLEAAIGALPETGGTVILLGDTTVGTASAKIDLAAKSGKVKITSENCAKLIIARTACFNCEIEFDNVDLCTTHTNAGFVYAGGHKLTINENVKTSIANTADKYLYIYGGFSTDDNYDLNTHLVIKAGTYENIYGGGYNADFTGASKVELSGVIVKETVTAQMRNPDYTFTGTSEIILDLRGNKTVSAGSFRETPTCLVDDGYEAVCFGSMYFQWKPGQETLDTVYVRDGGTGDGSSAATPIGSLAVAYALLGEDGGTVVLCGDTTFGGSMSFPECTDTVTFRAENGAKLILNGSLALSKNTNGAAVVFDLPVEATNATICGGFRNVTFAENFTVTGTLDFYGGVPTGAGTDTAAITELPYTITVKGGTFRHFAGGSRRNSSDKLGSIVAPLTVNIMGGNFTDTFSLSGDSILADDVTLAISGGNFACPIYVRSVSTYNPSTPVRGSRTVASDRKYYAMDGDITIHISGGTFDGGLISAYDVDTVAYTQVMRGRFTVTVTGGIFVDGTEFDATQVKAYAGETDDLASITYPDTYTFITTRFDSVNGMAVEYEEPLRIAFVGDSITEGVGSGASLTKSYPAYFAGLSKADDREVVVSNLGHAGAAARPDLSYYPSYLSWTIAIEETDADYIVLALGTNDHSAATAEAKRIAFENSYRNIIEELGGLPDTDKVFITNAIARGEASVSVQQIRVASLIRPMQERIAKAFSAEDADKFVFVDLYGLTVHSAKEGPLLGSDNLHPSAKGYEAMAEAIYGAIFNGVTTPEPDYRHGDVYLSASGSAYASGTKDDPTSSLAHALALLPYDGEGTIHVIGTIVCGVDAGTTMLPAKLTIVGEGSDAVLKMTGGTHFKILGDVEFDNITLKTTATEYLLVGGYNSIAFTDSVTLEGNWSFAAGFNVTASDTEESSSSGKDCIITFDGSGSFGNFMLGNYRSESKAPIGTYSGNLMATIGDAYTVAGGTVGAVGQNYLSGSATVFSPFKMAEYATIGTLSDPVVYDKSKNTGVVSVTFTGEDLSDVVYVDGTGMTEGAYTTFEEAVAAAQDGDTIIVCGNTTVSGSAQLYLKKALIITSERDAVLTMSRAVNLGGATEFKNIHIKNAASGEISIYCHGHALTMGENVTVSGSAISIYCGGGSNATITNGSLLLKSGTWKYVFSGNLSGTYSGAVSVQVDGATITGALIIGNNNTTSTTFDAVCDVTVKSGTVAEIKRKNSTNTYTVTVSGGTVTKISVDALVDLAVDGSAEIGSYTGTLTTKAPEGYKVVVDGTLYTVAKELVVGDVTGDDAITVVDVLLILKAILNDTALENADMNGDDVLTLVDVIKALKAITA